MGKTTLDDLTKGLVLVTEDKMLSMYEDFLKYIEENGYEKIPSKSSFADYIGYKRKEVYEWIASHPFASDKMRNMTADTLVAGAMLKKYVPNVTSFALKNWCGWEEAPKATSSKGKEESKNKRTQALLDEYIAEERLKEINRSRTS